MDCWKFPLVAGKKLKEKWREREISSAIYMCDRQSESGFCLPDM